MKPDGVAALVARVPEWAGRDLDIRPLHGGITNRNFVVTVDGAEETLRALGLDEHLTPQRANGLRSMIKRIKQEARSALVERI